MMKYRSIFLALALCFSLSLWPTKAQAELPPRVRAFLTVSGYGAAGGALLGLASMAFGTSTRAVAQGASLGLYAGILFGTYVIVSHHQRSQKGSYENSTPYNEGDDDYGDYGDEGEEDAGEEGGGGFFDSSYRAIQLGETLATATEYQAIDSRKASAMPSVQMNFFSYQF